MRARALQVAAGFTLFVLVSGAAVSALSVGLAELVANGWDAIGAMLVIGALLGAAWVAGCVLVLRHVVRRHLRHDARLWILVAFAVAAAAAGWAASLLAAQEAVPGGSFGVLVYGPVVATLVLGLSLSRYASGAPGLPPRS